MDRGLRFCFVFILRLEGLEPGNSDADVMQSLKYTLVTTIKYRSIPYVRLQDRMSNVEIYHVKGVSWLARQAVRTRSDSSVTVSKFTYFFV